MKTIFGKLANRQRLLIPAGLTMLLGLAVAANVGAGLSHVGSGSREPASTEYRLSTAPQPDAAEIDRQVQQIDALRFGLGSNRTAPLIVCPSEMVCAD